MDEKTVNPIQIQKFLAGVDYPATKDELVDSAVEQGADDSVIESLQSLPDQEYQKPTDVSEALGKKS
ncbi:DUF2795 domain-containing protein [candidate division WWE3 bacterium]|nr:DUF2795 domain-containing protein [candidate division WWE3 bacterium]